MNKIIGILGMQGAIAEHQEILLQIPHTKIRIVKTAKDLDCIDGLILEVQPTKWRDFCLIQSS